MIIKRKKFTSDLVIIAPDSQIENINSAVEVACDIFEEKWSKFNPFSDLFSKAPELPATMWEEVKDLLNQYNKGKEVKDYTCFAKGFVLDKALMAMISCNFSSPSSNYMVNFGGDLVAKGLEHFIIEGSTEKYYFSNSDDFRAIFTSGNTEKRGDHIIKLNGEPAMHGKLTIIADAKTLDGGLMNLDALTTFRFAEMVSSQELNRICARRGIKIKEIWT